VRVFALSHVQVHVVIHMCLCVVFVVVDWFVSVSVDWSRCL